MLDNADPHAAAPFGAVPRALSPRDDSPTRVAGHSRELMSLRMVS